MYEPPENFDNVNEDITKTDFNSKVKISTKYDVWSFGLILIEVFGFEKPWKNCSDQNKIILKLMDKEEINIPNLIKNTEIGSIVKKCTDVDPKKRIDIKGANLLLLDKKI